MIWQQKLDELRSYIKGLERDLAEVDALVNCHAYAIDPNPRSMWPPNSTLAKALDRHMGRCIEDARKRVNA